MRIAVYARVSTGQQEVSNQLPEIERYVAARGWQMVERFMDEGASGARETRPALDAL
jgi:DNA invertase Pin-like site-specific DNA recombinase